MMDFIYFIGFCVCIYVSIQSNSRTKRMTELIDDLKLKIRSLESNLDVLKAQFKLQKDQTSSVAATIPPPKTDSVKVDLKTPSVEPYATRPLEISQPVFVTTTATNPIEADPLPSIQQPTQTASPNEVSRLFAKIQSYFMSGNTLVKVGVVLIFFGISFLLKYAIDNNILPIEIRLIAAAVFGLALVNIGWNLRLKSRDYGLVLQGGGIGVLFLTTFVSMRMYSLISPELAFLLLIAFTSATAFLAVKQDSMNLAAFGLSGGFLAPILVSTGQGQHVVLFSYYTLLNLAIVFISWKKAWRELNLIGFIFTFGIAGAWGVLKYQPEFYSTTQPFLILFFLIYLAIPIMFADKKEPQLKGYVDGTLVFGNSIITIILQLQLVEKIEYGGAFSALILAGFYIFLSWYLIKHQKQNYRTLADAFISIGVVFTTIAIPLAFDGLKTSAIWALEAAGLYWIAIKQQRTLARYFSTALIFITSISFFLGPARGQSDLIFLNTFFFSCIFMAVGSYIVSYLSDKHKTILNGSYERWVSNLTLAMGTAWWVIAGGHDIHKYSTFWSVTNSVGLLAKTNLPALELLYLSVGAVIVFSVAQKLVWDKGRYLAHGFIFLMTVMSMQTDFARPTAFINFRFLVWALAFAVYYHILFNNDKNFDVQKNRYLKLGHASALWLLVGIVANELKWFTQANISESGAWQIAAQGVFPILIIWLITEKKERLSWPVEKNHNLYMTWGLTPIVAIGWVWLTITNWDNGGSAAPLPYIPLLNPMELAHIGMLFVSTLWVYRIVQQQWRGNPEFIQKAGVILGATYFFWLNGVLCRAIHQYMGVRFTFNSLFASVEVQVGLSIFWSILGITIMIFGSKKMYRWLWITGASLLGVVVAKMFLIDLSKTGSMGRVASFIIVGILFLIVGYFSPIPPKNASLETLK